MIRLAIPNIAAVTWTPLIWRFAFGVWRFAFSRTTFRRVLLICFLASASAPLVADDLAQRHAALDRGYANQLEELAVWCDRQGLKGEAAATRSWIAPQEPLTLMLALPADTTAAPTDRPAGEWSARFEKLRQAQGQALYDMALSAAEESEFALAFQWAHAVLREDPDHAAARKLLGYKQHEGRWLTQFEYNKARSNQTWHPRFGWLPRKQVARYEAGDRFHQGRWISADEDARLHADMEHAREIATEHFQLHTDCGLEEAVALAARLEEFYGVWRQVFVRFVFSEEQLARLFREGKPLSRRSRSHQVTCFRDRKEYNAALIGEYPNIDATRGFYLGRAKTAYLFAGPEQDVDNVYHEVTHQLFYETSTVVDVGPKANFWVVEGIACFAESYRRANQVAVLGGADAWRLKNARVRLLRDGFYIGLAELCELGMQALQAHGQLKEVYSEASGLTYFLLFAEEGRYRRALIDYLAAVYANRDRPDTLATLTETSFSKLDEQYQHFIRNLP